MRREIHAAWINTRYPTTRLAAMARSGGRAGLSPVSDWRSQFINEVEVPMFQEPYFPKSEFEQRWQRARQAMEELNVGALLATNPGNQFWLTGYQGSLSGDKFPEFAHEVIFPRALLPYDGEPVLFGLDIARDTYAHETHVSDIRTFLPPVTKRLELIAESLKSSGVARGRVGLDLGCHEGITVPELERLKTELPDVEWVDATDTFERLRMVKTENEIAVLKTAVEIQNWAFRKFLGRIERGMSETDLMWTMFGCQGDAGATEVGIAMPWTHPGYTFFRQQYPERSTKPGDFQWFDGGAIYHGYTSDYDMILSFGEPSEEAQNAFTHMRRIYEDGLEHFVPGRPIADIARDVTNTVRQHNGTDPLDGAFIGHNLGYDMVEKPWLGIGSPPDLLLEPGMVIAPEWFVVTPFGPILYEENFVVREHGLERLTNVPRELQVIE